MGERIAGKPDGPSPIIYGPPSPPPPPPNSQKCKFFRLGPIYMKNWWLYFSLVMDLSALWWGLTALQFSFSWVWCKAPQNPPPPPPNMKKKSFFFIFGLNFTYQIVYLFDSIHIYCERIAGKQDRPSLIIEWWAPQIAQNIIIFFYILAHIWKTGFQIVSPSCTYVSTVMRSAFAHISVPLVPLHGYYVRALHDPNKNI